ncbi:hypothetical protein LI134_00895 [Streptococcus parasanguinis]|uniref:hypothetical protein n=1 Tax=Streptococcus parasanguinis TaxID=1318 RepID=UPI00066BE41B|nr:hypothetical protein [Streptococcus parasanguinis]QBX27117.1 hypothetical protein Javan370_0036 [Streptococcus phage Javan370]DAF06704.1 MAG TPA: hypothetical protein [Caudoviricetes sp.]MCB6478855.1 hypothetical protein [Streptococcus parasanguinis]MCQ5185705.1 hypothetical protein [Streptococcus parasanguinis]DAJ84935.1 MAG TPA: hypothetical protein [Caudoviricetes sp.]
MLETIQDFFDLKENVVRHVGDIFEVDDDRKNELMKKLPDFVKEYDLVASNNTNEDVVVEDE